MMLFGDTGYVEPVQRLTVKHGELQTSARDLPHSKWQWVTAPFPPILAGRMTPDGKHWRWFGWFDVAGHARQMLIPISASPRIDAMTKRLIVRVKAEGRPA